MFPIAVKEKVNTCPSSLCSQWDNITAVLASRDDLSPLVLEQYLSLCLECLRLLLLTAEKTIPFNFLSSLPIMMKLVVAGCSPFCNVRFTNVLRKVIRNNNGNCSELTVSLFHSLDFQSFQSVANFALENWFQHVSRGVYDMFIIEYNIMQDSSSVEYNLVSKSDISISHVEQTFLRKYLLLTLEMISFATNSTNIVSQCRPLYDLLSLLKSLSLQNVHHSLSDKLIVLFLRKLILYLVLEEDGVLVGTLTSLFKLSELIEHLPPLVVQAFSIHHFFLQFVTSIGFDNSTVLDFIISNETDFDLFLANYLKLISSDSGGTSLALACQERDAISVKHSTNQSMEGQDTESVKVSSDSTNQSMEDQDTESAKVSSDSTNQSMEGQDTESVKVSSDSTNQSMEDQDTESVKVSSDQETFCDSVVSEVTKTSYDDSDGEGIEEITLDKLLNCFSRLYTQLENAKTKNLVTGKKIAVISEILDRIEMMA